MEVIHLVLGKLNPDRLNGVNKVVYNLATEQSKAGRQIEVWGITKNPVHDYPKRNFKTRLFKSKKNPFGIYSKFKKAVLQKKDSVFHFHGGWIPVFSSIASFLHKNNIRYVITPHGAYNEIAMNRSRFLKKVYFYLFEKKIISNAAKIHVIGESEVCGLHSIYPNQKTMLLPYGFDYEIRDFMNHKNNNFTIGFMGRLDVVTKGLDLLLAAFVDFHSKERDSCLWIIGEGDGLEYIQKFKTQHRLNNIVLWGKKFGKEKEELISQMHVFAHPSRNEGLPSSVLEAAAMGVPSVVSFATNLGDYVLNYNSGIVVANESVSELSKAFFKLKSEYDNESTAKYIKGTQDMLLNVFAWPLLVEKFDELYTI